MASFSESDNNTKRWLLGCLTFTALLALLALLCSVSSRHEVVSLRMEVETLRNIVTERCYHHINNDKESFKQQFNRQGPKQSGDDDIAASSDYDAFDDDDNHEGGVISAVNDDNHDDGVLGAVNDDNHDDEVLSAVNQRLTNTQEGEAKIWKQLGHGLLLSVLANGGGQIRIRRGSKAKTKPEKRNKKRRSSLDVVQFMSSSGPGHPLDIIDDWHYADWVAKDLKRKFSLGLSKPNLGKIEFKSTGIYLVIAQISYTGMKDREFKIIKEKHRTGELETIACCIQAMRLTKVHNDTSAMSTCHTSSLMIVDKRDKVYVKETIAGSGATFETGYSFLAFVRLR